jgi:hypothetical protein
MKLINGYDKKEKKWYYKLGKDGKKHFYDAGDASKRKKAKAMAMEGSGIGDVPAQACPTCKQSLEKAQNYKPAPASGPTPSEKKYASTRKAVRHGGGAKTVKPLSEKQLAHRERTRQAFSDWKKQNPGKKMDPQTFGQVMKSLKK